MISFAARALALAMGLLFAVVEVPAQAGDLYPVRKDREGNCIEPANTGPISVYCPQGWVKRTAWVSDTHWRMCKDVPKRWYASWRDSNGIRKCTQRFFTQQGEFCAPPEFTGRAFHVSRYDQTVAEFNFYSKANDGPVK